jgi:hypothetical protein
MPRHARLSVFLAACIGLCPSSLESQEGLPVVELELGGGVTFGADAFGSVYPIRPEPGYLLLDEIDRWASVRVGARFQPLWGAVRPTAHLDYALDADVDGIWHPCDPGLACADILLKPAVRVSRLAAAVGVEVPLPVSVGPVSPHATVAVGLRRYDVQWRALGHEPDDFFVLPEGSHGETGFVGRVGGGASAPLRWNLELWAQVNVDLSDFGPGVVPVQAVDVQEPSEMDLGRERRRETSVTVGLRRALF